jgi:branched-chain amino acid aminotransferase
MNPRAAETVVWVNGSFVAAPATTAAITALDDGVLTGRGVFETVAIRHGMAFARRRHLARLHASAGVVGIDLDVTIVDAGVGAVLAEWGPRNGRLRITVTAGSAVIVSASVVAPVEPTASLVVAPWPRNERSPLVAAKTTAYLDNVLAFEFARTRGATDALFLNTRGEVCEGSRTNVFAVSDGRLATPPLSAGCLAGVTRALVLDYGGATEATLDLSMLIGASEVFLTSALRGAQPVVAIDGTAVGNGTNENATRVARLLSELNADA